MKRLSIAVFIVALVIVSSAQKANLSYHFTFEYEPNGDFAQIQLSMNVKDATMSKTVQRADFLMAQIQQLGEQYCKKNKLKNCQVTVKIFDETITPLYTLGNKEIDLSRYEIQETVSVRVKNVSQIGPFIDELVNLSPEIEMLNFFFTAESQQQIEQQSLETGLQEGFRLCKQMKGKLHTITKVEEVQNLEWDLGESQTENGEQSDEQEQDHESYRQNSLPNMIEWNFETVCSLD